MTAEERPHLEPWLERAAVLDTFDRTDLNKIGEELWPHVLRRAQRLSSGRFRIRDSVRAHQLRRLIRENKVGEVRRGLNGSNTRRQRYLDAWLSGDSVPWENLETQELRAALQVLRWLESVPGPSRPQVWQLAGRLRVLNRIEPLDEISRHFLNRDSQLRELQEYVSSDDRKPLMICGVGGSGKSALVSKFIVELHQQGTASWVYLDVDDEAIDPLEPTSLIEEMVRQIQDQSSDTKRLSRIVLEGLDSDSTAQQQAVTGARDVTEVHDLLRRATSSAPFVVVLDTFERAQAMGLEQSQDLVTSLRKTLDPHDRARLVISGRVPMSETTIVKVGDLPKEAALALLEMRLQREVAPSALEKLIKRVGRLPLALLLTADALNQALDGAEELIEDLDELDDRINEERIQGFLYTRILGHLRPGKDHRLVAHATLAIPAFDERMLCEVIAPACQIEDAKVTDDLFEELSAEVAFVQRADPSGQWFMHRPDLRQHVQPFLAKSLGQHGIHADQLNAQAQLWLSKQEEVPHVVQQLFDEAATPIIIREQTIADQARALVGAGRAEEARDLLLAASSSRDESEGFEVLAHAYDELGENASALDAVARSISASIAAGEKGRAIHAAIWAADRLDQPGFVPKVLEKCEVTSLDRLKLLAAEAAADRRWRNSVDVSTELLEAWQQVSPTERFDDPTLIGRLAGLIGEKRPEAIREALESVGLRNLHHDDRRRLAFGLDVWDAQASGDPDHTGPIASMFGLFSMDPDPDRTRVDLWMDALTSHAGSRGSDVAQLLMKVMYSIKSIQPILETLREIYAARDDRSLLRPRDVGSTEPHEPELELPKRLVPRQRHAISNLIATTFTTSELQRLLFEALPDLAKAIPSQSDRTTAAFSLVEAAEQQGRLKQLLDVMTEFSGSLGLDEHLREALVESPWDDGISPQRIESYLEAGAVQEALELLEALREDLEHTKRRLPSAVTRKIFRTLHDYQLYEPFESLSRLIREQQPDRVEAVLNYARALIGRGKMTSAIQELQPLLVKVSDPELVHVCVWLALAYERLYLDADPSQAEPRRRYLEAACQYYERGFSSAPWFDVYNLEVKRLALRAHDARFRGSDSPKTVAEAQHIRRKLDIEVRTTSVEHFINQLELRLIANQHRKSIRACRRVLEHPHLTRFILRDLLTRLMEVHLLDEESEPGNQILPIVRVRFAQFAGGRIEVPAPDLALHPPSEVATKLEKAWGDAPFRPLQWLKDASRAAKSAVRIHSKDGTAIGMGVLVAGNWTAGATGAENPRVLTTAHLFSEKPNSRVKIEDCLVHSGESNDPTAWISRIRELFTDRELDVTLLELLDPPVNYVLPVEVSQPGKTFPLLPGERVTIIGPSVAGALSLSDAKLNEVGRSQFWYTTPPVAGSSGSPVFDGEWKLVGLHHAHISKRMAGEANRMDRILTSMRNRIHDA